MTETDEFLTFYNRALFFLKFRPRSRFEIESFLKRKKASEVVKNQVIEKLENLNLINDKEFARWFIDQRQQFRPRGKMLLTLELRQKGISPEVIAEALTTIDASSQTEKAIELLERKINLWREKDIRVLRKKAQDFLLRRGFSYAVVRDAVQKVIDRGE